MTKVNLPRLLHFGLDSNRPNTDVLLSPRDVESFSQHLCSTEPGSNAFHRPRKHIPPPSRPCRPTSPRIHHNCSLDGIQLVQHLKAHRACPDNGFECRRVQLVEFVHCRHDLVVFKVAFARVGTESGVRALDISNISCLRSASGYD